MSLWRCFLISLPLLLGAALYAAPKEPDHITSEDRGLFEWYDSLGIEDITHARLVRVRTGNCTVNPDESLNRADEPRAFLLSEQGAHFTAVLSDLETISTEHHGKNLKDPEYIGWREVSLKSEVESLLRTLATKRPVDEWADRHDSIDDKIYLPAQAFALARYCAAHDQEALSARLMRAVESAAKDQGRDSADYLQMQLSMILEFRAELALANPQLDRHAQARLFQNVAEKCPKYVEPSLITKPAEGLRRLAEEDDKHQKLSAEEFARLAPGDQARELVFQLRDENPDPDEYPIRPWPFKPATSNGALARLKALGHAAVPALIDALDDDRPSRAVLRNAGWASTILSRTIQNLALEALEEIIGARLVELLPSPVADKDDEMWKQFKTVAEDWWKATQEKGELGWLRARALAGGHSAAPCLDVIASRYPDALPGLINVAFERTKETLARAAMLERLKSVRTRDADELLREEMLHGPTLGNRVVAAYAMRQRDRAQAMAAMATEIASIQSPVTVFDPKQSSEVLLKSSLLCIDRANSAFHLLVFFLSCDSPEAIQQVEKILAKCDTFAWSHFLSFCDRRLTPGMPEEVEPAGPATVAAIEALLTSRLGDHTTEKNFTFNSVKAPTVGELAAWELAKCWPEKYHFDLNATPKVRAAQLAAIQARLQRH